MPVRIQSEFAIIDELQGALCEQLLAIPDCEPDSVIALYLRVNHTWHRAFIDAGVLFWHEGHEPDAEDDLGGQDEYVDLAADLNLVGRRVRSILYEHNTLAMDFSGNARLVIVGAEDGTFIREAHAASDRGIDDDADYVS